jgi:hypothetical protein
LAQQGAFNPAQQTFNALHAGQAGLSSALGSEAGAARALGYRPGDSVPLTEMNQTQGNFQLQQAGLANQIAQQSRANYLGALQGAPSLSDLGSGIAATGENARMFEGQDTGLGGLLGSLAPLLGGGQTDPSLVSAAGSQQGLADQQQLQYMESLGASGPNNGVYDLGGTLRPAPRQAVLGSPPLAARVAGASVGAPPLSTAPAPSGARPLAKPKAPSPVWNL